MQKDWRGIKFDITLIEHCFNDNFIEGFHLYSFMRLVGHKSAGYVRKPWLLQDFAKQSGYSDRKMSILLRGLKKRGWIMKFGKYYHVSSLNRVKNQIVSVRPEFNSRKSQSLAWRDIVKDKKVFKADCVEYFKAKAIRSRFMYEIAQGNLDVKKSASTEADNSYTRDYNFGDFSYRLTSQYLGLSIGHLYHLRTIQKVSTYHKRYCPEFDKANITNLQDLKAHVKAANSFGDNLCEAMFEYCRVMVINPFSKEPIYRLIKRYRRRMSDYIATTAEIVNRVANKKDKRKRIEDLLRLMPSTRSGIRDENSIIDFHNMNVYNKLDPSFI